MKKTLFLLLASTALMLTATAQTNDFYDDAPSVSLKGSHRILITGEIARDTTVDLSMLPVRSMTVKETSLTDGKTGFTGAYRYDGCSLYDILNLVVLKKKNEAEFPPIIDLYVEVSNVKGETVVFSWGEIYYPVNLHRIMIATSVARIVPSKTKDLWPLPEMTKVVAGNDLVTIRNIESPVKITVRSSDRKYAINRSLKPLYSETMRICVNDSVKRVLENLPGTLHAYTYNTVFYGRGTGIHGTTPFTGAMLSDILKDFSTISAGNLSVGLVIIAGADGYRGVFTLSEIMNRNDQEEILLIDRNNYEGAGKFSLFPACYFFSDRAIKAVSEINLLLPEVK